MIQSKGLDIVIYGFLCMIILSLILMLFNPQTEIRFQHRRAFIIGVDGIGNFPKFVDVPGIRRVIDNGVYTFEGQTVYPTLSVECWTTLLHGVGPEKHQIYSYSKDEGYIKFTEPKTSFPYNSSYPSIFKLMYEKDNRARMACFSNWEFIPKYIVEDGIGVFKYFTKSEKKLIDKFENYMKSNDPWVVFFQLDDTDVAGHKYGYFSDGQKKQLEKTDMAVSRIIDIIEKYDTNNDSLILIQTDHGGGGDLFADLNIERNSKICDKCMHGSKEKSDMTIFWTARGKGICKSKKIDHQVSIKDTARFVASYLNLNIPNTWDGYDLYPELRC